MFRKIQIYGILIKLPMFNNKIELKVSASMKRKGKKSGCLYSILVAVAVFCLCVIAGGAVLLKMNLNKETKQQARQVSNVPYQEVDITEKVSPEKYYYNQINDDDKKVYQEILEGVKTNTQEIFVHSKDADRTNLIFQYVLKDYPEIFWCDSSIKSTTYDDKEPYTIVTPAYLYGEEEKTARKAEIEAAVQECLSGIKTEDSDYEKILYIYEYIVNTVDYETDAPDNQNICSVFINKKSVCAGYSRAAQYLLERLGVFCTYVTGVTNDNENHAWNLVKCNGNYYYLDVTWGDPVFQETAGEPEISRDFISYDYMCCDDKELLKTHTPDADIPLPECTMMDDNYYVVNGMYYTQYDGGAILKAMNAVISKKENPVVLKFADSELYNQAREDVLENQVKTAAQNIADWYGLKEVKYQYMDEPELNKITIYWQYE